LNDFRHPAKAAIGFTRLGLHSVCLQDFRFAFQSVFPAKAGAYLYRWRIYREVLGQQWVPAFAGMKENDAVLARRLPASYMVGEALEREWRSQGTRFYFL
jgi:hypothetical protein